jgi:hypothetical protein
MILASWAQDEALAPIIANSTHRDRDQTIVIISSTEAMRATWAACHADRPAGVRTP